MEAPWHGRKVGWVLRSLAWVYICCVFIGVLAVCLSATVRQEMFRFDGSFAAALNGVVTLLLTVYLTILFGKVAFTGFEPKTWLPWR